MFYEKYKIKVMYMNRVEKDMWKEWKWWDECSEEEKKKANLRQIFPNEIVLDIEDKGRLDEVRKLLKNYKYYIYNSGSRGLHIHLYYNNIDKLSERVRKELRRVIIKQFKADESKASEMGVIAIENKPHFKTNKIKKLIEKREGVNVVDEGLIKKIIKKLDERKKIIDLRDEEFKNYHIKDKFFNYIKTHTIQDNTNRDLIIFPNIAIALVKEGLSKEEIDKIMKPIIKNNFPNKNYGEFEGWLKKAFDGEITTYNPIQINNWIKTYTDLSEMYDVDDVVIERLKREFNVYWDKDLGKLKDIKVEWLVDKWIPEGDICFIAGKAASFKTTIALHIAYAISEGKLVFENYKTKKERVLYMNEENNRNVLLNIVKRVKGGLDIEKSDGICFTILEGLRLDKRNDIEKIIKFINENNIRVLICDSFRRFIGFDENKATEMNELFNNLKELRRRCGGITIIILHHLKKENYNNPLDMRDMLRGSSDIVNSADSVINVRRKYGKNNILIQHIKNRVAEELVGKVLIVGSREGKEGEFYVYESGKDIDKDKILSLPEKCSEYILKYLEEKDIKIFSRKDIKEVEQHFSFDVITKALRLLVEDGVLVKVGDGKRTKYILE